MLIRGLLRVRRKSHAEYAFFYARHMSTIREYDAIAMTNGVAFIFCA